jgi:hypothetical protein
MDASQRSVRRLRRTLIAVSMLCAVLVLVIAAVLIYWRLYLLEPSGDPFTRGPYLVALSEHGARLKWRLDHDAAVELRAVSDAGDAMAARDGAFTGLAADTGYAWTASVDGRTRASGRFVTAPSNLSQPVGFAVIGDYGSGNDHEWAVGRVLAAADPRFVLTAGDNSYLAAVPPLLDRNIFRPLASTMRDAPLWATMGEHDLVWEDGGAVTDALDLPGAAGRYQIRYGPIQLVLLGLEATGAAADFARAALAEPGPQVRFVVVHRPMHDDDPLLPALRAAHVAAVFAGHLHRYERRMVGGLVQFTVGTGGQGAGNEEFTKATPGADFSTLDYGLLRVQVSESGIRFTFVDERGRVLDRFQEPLS